MKSSVATAIEDEVANGETTELPPNLGDRTPDNKLTAGAATNEDEDTITERKSAERTSKQAEDTHENKMESSVTPAKVGADIDANGKPTCTGPGAEEDTTYGTQTQGAETDTNDKCADRTQKDSRTEKGGELTEPTLSKVGTITDVNIFPDAKVTKGDKDSKCLEESLRNEDEKHDAAQNIQTLNLQTEIEQLKLKLEVVVKDRDEKGKGIEEFCTKDIANQMQIFQLQEELKESTKMNKRENNEYKKKDLANETYKAELHKRIKKVEKEKTQQQDKITKQEEEIRKQKEEIKRLNGKLKHIETLKQKYENKSESEIKSLTGYIAELNANIIAIESKRNTEIKYWKKEYEVEQQNVLSLSRQYSEVTQRLQTTQGEVRSLTEEKQELLLRLSKVAGANLTYNNPNIADLSDEKRPTKLAEEFSELYDNEWTDVFEELDFKTENEKTNFMLDILMKTNAICSGLSNGHTKRIKAAFCSLTTTCHIMKRSTVEKKEVVLTDLQNEAKVAILDKDMVKEGKNEKYETHGNDEPIDSRRAVDFKNKLEHETTEVIEQDTTDSTTVTESREKTGKSVENDLKHAAEAQHDGTDNGNEEMIIGKAKVSKAPETHNDSTDKNPEVVKVGKVELPKIPKVKHDSIERKNEENEEGKAEPPKDESTAGYSNTVNADQNKSMSNQDKHDEIPEAKHDSKDKGHADNKEDKAEPPKKSKLDMDMDKNPEENKYETKVDTIAPEAQHGGTDKETEEKIGREILPQKDESANTINTDNKENVNRIDGVVNQKLDDNTDNPPEQNKEENQVETSRPPIKDKTDNDALEAPEATNSPMDDVTGTETEILIESDFELLQKEQKKTIMDAKNFFENQLAKEVGTTVADIIGKAFQTDTEKTTLTTYITKCVNICWSMRRHNPPVFIEFPDVKESTLFDTNKYKPYTSSGKFIDYIVWPALYLHENGPLLCKGVAQGLGNKKSK